MPLRILLGLRALNVVHQDVTFAAIMPLRCGLASEAGTVLGVLRCYRPAVSFDLELGQTPRDYIASVLGIPLHANSCIEATLSYHRTTEVTGVPISIIRGKQDCGYQSLLSMCSFFITPG